MSGLGSHKRLLPFFLAAWLMGSGMAWAGIPWQDITPSNDWLQPAQLQLQGYRSVGVDYSLIETRFLSADLDSLSTFSFPMPDGSKLDFLIWLDPILPPGLAASYPGIRTYTGYCPTDLRLRIKLDVGAYGMHGLVLGPDADVFLDPATDNNPDIYISYRRENAQADGRHCTVTQPVFFPNSGPMGPNKQQAIAGNGSLKSLRMASSTTAELSAQHQGSNYHILSALVSLTHRANGVYERDLGMRLLFAEGTDQLFFKQTALDPFSSGPTATAAILSQENSTALQGFGDSLYDLSICFSDLDELHASGISCESNDKSKASFGMRGRLGSPFDLGHFAHLCGHLFGANHTQNINCSRVGSAAFEPGSGTSIMGLAGQCPASFQDAADAYYHVHSIIEIRDFLENGPGANCGTDAAWSNNLPPVIQLPSQTIYIPPSTPIRLWALQTQDPEGSPMSFTWEQYNLGPSSNPNMPSGSAPIIRSLPPRSSDLRCIPNELSLIRDIPSPGELLPQYGRDLRFRLTARDNHLLCGGISYEQLDLQAVDMAPAFEVTDPAPQIVWQTNQLQQITWEVGQTADSLINCSTVNIYFSRDSGWTYPDTLAIGTPNNGRFLWFVPRGKETGHARIMVEGNGHYFFNVSTLFQIVPDIIGLEEFEPSAFGVYPNPWKSGQSLRINYLARSGQSSGQTTLELVLMDVQGRQINKEEVLYSFADAFVEWPDQMLGAGIYLLRITDLENADSPQFLRIYRP